MHNAVNGQSFAQFGTGASSGQHGISVGIAAISAVMTATGTSAIAGRASGAKIRPTSARTESAVRMRFNICAPS